MRTKYIYSDQSIIYVEDVTTFSLFRMLKMEQFNSPKAQLIMNELKSRLLGD